MRKIAFAIHRMVENKIYAPLISEALRRGWHVEVWLDQHDVSTSTKWYEFPKPELFPDFAGARAQIKFLSFHNDAEYEALCRRTEARYVFSEYPPPFAKPPGQKWLHVVSCFYDSQCSMDAQRFAFYDTIFANSPFWVEEGIEYYRIMGELTPELEKRFRHTWVTTGTTQFDHPAFCTKESARAALGIPPGKGVVTVFAFEMNTTFWSNKVFLEHSRLKRIWNLLALPFTYPLMITRIGQQKLLRMGIRSLWDRFRYLPAALRSVSELDAMRAIRDFCDHNNCVFVLKARKKHILQPFHRALPDIVIAEDREYFPSTGAQAIAAADLMITFFSTAAAEGVAGGVPTINLKPPVDDYYTAGQFELLFTDSAVSREIANRRFYNSRNEGVFHFPGVIVSREANEFVRNFPRQRLGDFKVEPQAQAAYWNKFLGANPGRSVGHIFDWLEAQDSP